MHRWIVVLVAAGLAAFGANAAPLAYDLAVAEAPWQDAGTVVAGARADAFTPYTGPLLEPSRSTLRWYRITPRTDAPPRDPAVLALYAPFANRVTVFAPPDYSPVARSVRDILPAARWSRHALVFELPDRIAGRPIYVALDPARRLPPRVSLETRSGFTAGETRHLRLMTMLLTAIAVMCVVVGAFALALRERTFAYLFGALASMLVYVLLITGEGYDLAPLAWLGAYGAVPIWMARAASSGLLLLFLRRFLAVDSISPWLGRAFSIAAGAFFALVVLSVVPFLEPGSWLPQVGNVLLIASFSMAIAAALVAWRRGIRAARFFLPGWLPLIALDILREAQLLGIVSIYPGNEYAQPGATAFAALVLSAGMADRLLMVRRERDLARHEAERDPLTGALNRRAIESRIAEACSALPGPDAALSVLFLDLDHFKRINDRFGHATGDACLRAVVAIVERELRRTDAVGRYGGEELLVLLDGASLSHASVVAERIRAHIAAQCRVVAEHAVGLTASIGVADTATAGRDPHALVAAADAAMYAAKHAGRNAVRDGRDTASEPRRVTELRG